MLPILTSPDDVAALVDYLKTKATAVSLKDAGAAVDGRLLHPRKMSAYESWGFVVREADGIRLTALGRRFGRGSEETRRGIYADIVRGSRAYRVAADWIFHQEMDMVTAIDLAAHWLEHIPEELETSAEKTARNQAVTFFQLADSAGLGRYVLGRKTQPTRLEIDRSALDRFIGELDAATDEETDEADLAEELLALPSQEYTDYGDELDSEQAEVGEQKPPRVFISHGKNTAVVDQMKTMLELANLKYEVAVEEEAPAIPVSEKVLGAMRRCTSAVICVTADAESRREDNTFAINENVLIEIGAAFVLYDRRVVLVWDRRLPVPSNLVGLYRCEFEGDELSWGAGMKLLKAVNDFKKQPSSAEM